MQFSTIIVAAFAAVASASYNSTAPYPSGTGSLTILPTGTSTATPPPFTGAAVANTGSVFAAVLAGGVAMML